MRTILLLFISLIITGCAPLSQSYRAQYSHLHIDIPKRPHAKSDYFLIILVNARHLDYSNSESLLKTIAKHPDGTTNGDVGHAWIYLQGILDGKIVSLEGGHSGELGVCQPKYFDGIMDLIEAKDPNPVSYLWEKQSDGFFQQGPSHHRPTFAVRVNLTKEKLLQILDFISLYPFQEYRLTHLQCCSFVTQIAALTGLYLEDQKTITFNPTVSFRGNCFRLWSNPEYSQFSFGSPDILERSMIESVLRGEAEYALHEYYHKAL